jgi:hypothetical protein
MTGNAVILERGGSTVILRMALDSQPTNAREIDDFRLLLGVHLRDFVVHPIEIDLALALVCPRQQFMVHVVRVHHLVMQRVGHHQLAVLGDDLVIAIGVVGDVLDEATTSERTL